MKKPTTIPTRPVGPSGPTTGPAATTAPNKGIIVFLFLFSSDLTFKFSFIYKNLFRRIPLLS